MSPPIPPYKTSPNTNRVSTTLPPVSSIRRRTADGPNYGNGNEEAEGRLNYPIRESSSPHILLHNSLRTPDEHEITNFGHMPSLTQGTTGPVGATEERQFMMMRDSLVFTHERMMELQYQHQQPNSQMNTGSVRHYPSLTSMDSDFLTNNFIQDPSTMTLNPNRIPIPKLYSVANANANAGISPSRESQDSAFTRWMKEQQGSRCDIGGRPLSGTEASLNLSATTQPVSRSGGGLRDGSATTVTTAYSYKCDRTSQKHQTGTVKSVPKESTLSCPFPDTPVTMDRSRTGLSDGVAAPPGDEGCGDDFTRLVSGMGEVDANCGNGADQKEEPVLLSSFDREHGKVLETTQTDMNLMDYTPSYGFGGYATGKINMNELHG